MSESHLRPDGGAIGLSPERCGAERGAELAPPERALYRWILRRFAAGGAPTASEVEGAARIHDVASEPALARMERLDLVQLDAAGGIRCAYPFSAEPTGHLVELDGGAVTVHAMCAVDALGIPFMLRRAAVIHSADPGSGRDIVVGIDAAGAMQSRPSGAVVVVASGAGTGPLASLCCPLINLFESREHAGEFLDRRPELSGTVLSLAGALSIGRAVFEGVLD
jgi:hypothetical protein